MCVHNVCVHDLCVCYSYVPVICECVPYFVCVSMILMPVDHTLVHPYFCGCVRVHDMCLGPTLCACTHSFVCAHLPG